ncbi:hypothetical protein A7U60_g8450 [Sanghuangporus baumii]|uniref:Uncharacterized protein n=1 Tax=Sanghuangporus baumii TaxID=108892 RepID=A0A9Q5HRC5_SANBA|nr:hypothetical protein A7U60_g8450 [Sanghuangporus baumii]
MSPSPLPSFVELMESLGFAPDSKLPVSAGSGPDSRSQSRASSHSQSHSRSPSPSASSQSSQVPARSPRAASPTIIVSQYDAPKENGSELNFKRRASSGNIKAARFSPYAVHVSAFWASYQEWTANSCAIIQSRRGSMPAVGDHQRDPEQHRDKVRVFLTQPRSARICDRHETHSRFESSKASSQSSGSRRSSGSSSTDSIPPVPSLPVRRSRGEAMDRLKLSEASFTPISSFARRRSPQASPTSPSFKQIRARGTNSDLPSPVMIPTLPPMLAESLATFSFPASINRNHSVAAGRKERRSPSRSPHTSPMDLDQDTRPLVRHHQAGLRISSLHRQIAPIA